MLLIEVMVGKVVLVGGDEEVGKEKKGLRCNEGRKFERVLRIYVPIG